MNIVKYTEYSEKFPGSEDSDIAVTVQVPEELVDDLNEILLIIQEPKLLKLTLSEFQAIEDIVYRSLKEAGWKEEREGDGVGPS